MSRMTEPPSPNRKEKIGVVDGWLDDNSFFFTLDWKTNFVIIASIGRGFLQGRNFKNKLSSF